MITSEESVTTLVFPEDYLRQLNSVASVTTKNVIHLRRKFLSKSGWELVPIPLAEFTAIEYKKEIALARVLFGTLLSTLVVFIFFMLARCWNDLEPNTRVPIGALALAGIYGIRLALGVRRHRFTFSRINGARLVWKSRSDDDKIMQPLVDKLIEFSRSSGLMR